MKSLSSACRVCKRPSRSQRTLCKYCNTRVRRARLKLAAVALFGGKCQECGFKKNPWVMEFHHISDDKEFHISVVGLAWEKMKEELKKCIMLCANCHRALHCNRDADLMEVVMDYQGDMDLGLTGCLAEWAQTFTACAHSGDSQ